MKKFVFLMIVTLLALTEAEAFDVRLLANNKEMISRELSLEELTSAEQWARGHRLGAELRRSALKALSDTFNQLERVDTTCDLGLVEQLQREAKRQGVIVAPEEVLVLAAFLRSEDLIDDILYKILRDSGLLANDLKAHAAERIPPRPFNLNTRLNAGIDLAAFFAPMKTWPDDVSRCTLDTYFQMTRKLNLKNSRDRDAQLLRLNWMAVKDGAIDLATFNKLEALRQRGALDWNVYFKRYADVVNNAKDKLTKKPETKATNAFSIEYVSRRDGLTNRGNLYRTYDSTQIMVLAQIIEKTARRMDARQASLNWQYGDNPADREIYVLSPMEQYRAAIKMLRKEMAEVMRSEAFQGTGLQYDHLIAAAYEAGFIKSEELDMVLRFEDLWNPKTPKWKAYASFAFSLAGTASFYLPPPFNVIGAIALVLTQTKLVNGDRKPDEDDNWNVIL